MRKIFVLIVLVTTLFSCNNGVKNSNQFDYVAVKMEEGEDWSIIDTQGKLVVKQEYATDLKVNRVYKNVYREGYEGFYLYNISDPKKPINDKPFEKAILFAQSRALVSDLGEPIKLIDTDGEFVKELDKNALFLKSRE